MKRMKRLVALLVAIATMASLCVFSIPASAEDVAAETTAVTVTDEDLLRIEKLEALGVIDASYDPTTYVTRRKMADIIVKYMNIAPSANTDGTPFRDVTMKDSSFASICTLYNMGIVTGDDQLRFNPDNYVTYDEALVFIINAIGHKMFAEREGGYPTGYHRVAIKHNMLKGLAMQKGTDPVHFPDLYKMLEAALDAATVVPQYYGDGSVTYALSDTDTYLYTTYGIRKYHGIVTGNENTKLKSANSYLTDEQIEIDGQLYDTPGYVYDYFLGYAVDYYVKVNSSTDAEMVYIEEARNYNELIKVDAEDILSEKTTSDRIYYTDKEDTDKEYHLTFGTNYDVIYNNQCWTGYASLKDVIPDTGYIEALDNNNDGVIDVIFVYEYQIVIVESTNSYSESIKDKITGEVISINSVDNEVKIHFAGETKKRNFNSISQDSVLSILRSKSKEVITVYISNDAVTGKIIGSNSEQGYQIGEEWYESANKEYPNKTLDGTDLEVGLEGEFFLDMNGRIVYYKKDTGAKEGEMIGLVTAIQPSKSSLNRGIDLKIFTHEGEFIQVPVAKRVMINDTTYDLEDDERYVAAKDKLTYADVYLVRFTLNSAGEVSTMETTKKTGSYGKDDDGTIEILAENSTDYMTSRTGRMFLYKNIEGKSCISRMSDSHYTIMTIPGASQKSDDDLYKVYTGSVIGDRFWGNRSSGVISSASYSLYSFGLSDITMINVAIFRLADGAEGTAEQPDLGDQFGMVTDVSIGVNEDGEKVPVLYMDNGDKVLMAKEVAYYNTIQSEGKNCSSEALISGIIEADESVTQLKSGTIILYSTNYLGEVTSVEFIANGAGEALTAALSDDVHGKGGIGYDSAGVADDNIAIGKVVKVDTKEKLLQLEVNGSSDNTLITGGSVYIYYSAEDKLVSGKTADISSQDKVLVYLKDYLTISKIYIFK